MYFKELLLKELKGCIPRKDVDHWDDQMIWWAGRLGRSGYESGIVAVISNPMMEEKKLIMGTMIRATMLGRGIRIEPPSSPPGNKSSSDMIFVKNIILRENLRLMFLKALLSDWIPWRRKWNWELGWPVGQEGEEGEWGTGMTKEGEEEERGTGMIKEGEEGEWGTNLLRLHSRTKEQPPLLENLVWLSPQHHLKLEWIEGI